MIIYGLICVRDGNMSKYITIKDNRDDLDELYRKIHDIEHLEIRVGIFKEDDAQLLMIARVHEFGASIKVTEKMRNFLHSQGLHLRRDTTHINIPERSFVRTTPEDRKKELQEAMESNLRKYLTTKMSFKSFSNTVGKELSTIVKRQMQDLKKPELHPFTIERKGSDDPLIDKGNLLNSITYKVVR